MKRIMVFLIAFSLIVGQAPVLSAKRRPVGVRARGVDTSVFVIYEDRDNDGLSEVWVGWSILTPLQAGARYDGYVVKPGNEIWHSVGTASGPVPSSSAGKWRDGFFYHGEEFYDTLADGTKVPWEKGEARFFVKFTKPDGSQELSSTTVPVPVDPSAFTVTSVQKAVVNNSGDKILLLGVSALELPPQALVLNRTKDGMFIYPAEIQRNGELVVPAGISGKSWIVVAIGYPEAECTTFAVDIPSR